MTIVTAEVMVSAEMTVGHSIPQISVFHLGNLHLSKRAQTRRARKDKRSLLIVDLWLN